LALMATLSRASFLAAGILFFAIGATQWRRPPVMASLLLVLLIVPFLAPGNVQDRVMNTFFGRQYGNEVKVMGVALDSSTSERIRSWMKVVDGWSKKPVLGYGVTGYAWADAQYVKILGETGLVGLVAFFFLLYRLWFLARQAYVREQDPFLKGLAYGFLTGMVALLFHAIGANTFIIIRIMEPFWLCAGLVLLMPILERKEPSPAPP
ncbi:MAG: O-antigen ligase family protein, partial [Nitrospirales bacterium]